MARDGVMPEGVWPREKPTRPWVCRAKPARDGCTRKTPCAVDRGRTSKLQGQKKQREARKAIERVTGTSAARTWGKLGPRMNCTGTVSSYQRGCRCDDCRRASAEARARWTAKTRENGPSLDVAWREHAACKGKPTDWWFALPKSVELRRAVDVCAGCPVQKPCRDEAQRCGEVGLWGGAFRAPWLSSHSVPRARGKWKALVLPVDEAAEKFVDSVDECAREWQEFAS